MKFVLSEALLKWFDQFGRHDLPWQKNKTPYRIWVSEIMLQQTQVSTVVPYFKHFIKSFPTLKHLAQASEDEILHVWSGLGYYTRALHLYQAAKIIFIQYQGQFPNTFEEILALPGIGRSTAGAILSIAFEKAFPILDGNVKRVLCRLHAIQGWSGDKKIESKLWRLAEHYLPQKRVADYTQAFMDLGATICKRKNPDCKQCPFKKNCLAHRQGQENYLPTPKPIIVLPIRKIYFLILQDEKKNVLLEKRPRIGVWKGLWSFPELSLPRAELTTWVKLNYACEVMAEEKLESFCHTFSHYKLKITPILLEIKQDKKFIMEAANRIWYSVTQGKKIGLPVPVSHLLSHLKKLKNK